MTSEREPFTTGAIDFTTPRIDTEYTHGDAKATEDATSIVNMYNGATDVDADATTRDTEATDAHGTTVGADGNQTDADEADGQGSIGLPDDNQTDGRYVDGVFVPSEYAVSETDTENVGDVADAAPVIDQLPEGIEIVNGVAFIRNDTPERVQVVVRVDRSFKDRVIVVASLERRKLTTVIEESIRRFMGNPYNEPRPYLPPELYGEQDSRMAFYLSPEDKYMLEARARSECRSVMDVVRRAIVDYVEASPYDPKRYMNNVMSSETVQNRPTIDEQMKEVSEYPSAYEARLTPSEAQRNGDGSSEGVTE